MRQHQTGHNTKTAPGLCFLAPLAGCAPMATERDTSRVGGWRGSPNSIAALLQYRTPFGSPALRQCVACRSVAVRGLATCWRHSGKRRRDTPGRVAGRVLRQMDRRGLLPAELMALAPWRDLARLRRDQCEPLRLALVLAWDTRDSEPLAWARVWRDAKNAVRGGT